MINKPFILSVETATRGGSVSLSRGAEVMTSRSGDETASHSTDLIENIKAVISEAKFALSDVDLLAVAVGPGSFTGLRIGLATVKGLAACLNRKCVGVSTLGAIAHAAGPSSNTIALLPAGRGELFAQLFSVNGERLVESADYAAHLSLSAVLAKYGDRPGLRWAGEGARIHADTIINAAPDNSRWALAEAVEKLAESVAALALLQYQYGNAVAPDDLHAAYVRPSDAEINEGWLKQNPPSTIPA